MVSRLSGSTQEMCRNSTAMRSGARRSRAQAMYSRLGSFATKYGGNCIRIIPSLPSTRSGSSASPNREKVSARRAGSGWMTRPDLSSSKRPPSRSGGGSCSGLTAWRVIMPKALTWKMKPGGVRSAQRRAF